MSTFEWVAAMPDPPPQWDLRRRGWTLCRCAVGVCRYALLMDVRAVPQDEREQIACEYPRPFRMVMLGVDSTAERAALLALGCGHALARDAGLEEVEARARQAGEFVPRWRAFGPLTLDLLHRDVRYGDRWLALHPREFAVLWRLAENPGERVSRAELLRDVWRLNHDPETNSVAVHVSRLRSKLAEWGYAGLVSTDPDGGYRLDARTTEPLAHADATLEDG